MTLLCFILYSLEFLSIKRLNTYTSCYESKKKMYMFNWSRLVPSWQKQVHSCIESKQYIVVSNPIILNPTTNYG